MGTNEKPRARRASIDCPVCYSGNSFPLGGAERELTCEDCGFVLAAVHGLKAINSGRCIFCGGEHFFLDSPFSLAFLGRSTVCYVCEAKYKGVTVTNPDGRYDEAAAVVMRRSDAALGLKERVERYYKQPG